MGAGVGTHQVVAGHMGSGSAAAAGGGESWCRGKSMLWPENFGYHNSVTVILHFALTEAAGASSLLDAL